MQRITVTISIPADKQMEFGILLGQIGGEITTLSTGQTTQAKAETKTETKPAPKKEKLSVNEQKRLARKPGTSYTTDGASVGFLLEENKDGKRVVVEKRFNADTHRIFNCLAEVHLMDGEDMVCNPHAIGSNDSDTEMRYLESMLMFKVCFDADMTPRLTQEDIDAKKAKLTAKIELEAKRQEAMNKASEPTTDDIDAYPTKK